MSAANCMMSDHLVEIPLEVVLLDVNLLVGLDHILQLLLSLLSFLELKPRDAEKEKLSLRKSLDIHTYFFLCQFSNFLTKTERERERENGRNFYSESHQTCLCCVTKQIQDRIPDSSACTATPPPSWQMVKSGFQHYLERTCWSILLSAWSNERLSVTVTKTKQVRFVFWLTNVWSLWRAQRTRVGAR